MILLDVSINDLLDADLSPVILVVGIVMIIIVLMVIVKTRSQKREFDNTSEVKAVNVKVLSKTFSGSEKIVSGTLYRPVIGKSCTIVFEQSNGSRLVLRSSESRIYDKIVEGDIVNVWYKLGILTDCRMAPQNPNN